MSDMLPKDEHLWQDEPCEHCESNCPSTGYWHCPVCDAEWNDDDDTAIDYQAVQTESY